MGRGRYPNIRKVTIDGYTFASGAEAARYQALIPYRAIPQLSEGRIMCLNCELLERKVVDLEDRLTRQKAKDTLQFSVTEWAWLEPMDAAIRKCLASAQPHAAVMAYILARFGGEAEIMRELEALRVKVKELTDAGHSDLSTSAEISGQEAD